MAIQAQMYTENLGFPLGGSQDLLVDNGCGVRKFCLNPPQQQQQQQHHHHQQQQQQGQLPNMQLQPLHNRPQDFYLNSRSLRARDQSMASFSPNVASQIVKQNKEINQLISLQNERLRLALQEQRKQQITLLLKNYESKAQFLLQQKDEEIAKEIKRTIELEDLLTMMETENQTWQRVAKENEAMIMSLNNAIEQLRKGSGGGGACHSGAHGVEDAESCCEIVMNSGHPAGQEQRGEPDVQVNEVGMMKCKICSIRNSCVILLPCRHLCSCNSCVAFIESCPVCNVVKKASIEVRL
nr:BOI-related E3 ubiquitin-protein ligase 1-like [Coffea arabica]